MVKNLHILHFGTRSFNYFVYVKNLQIGFPAELTEQVAPGPHGEGLQGSGFSTQRLFWQTRPDRQSGSTTHSTETKVEAKIEQYVYLYQML